MLQSRAAKRYAKALIELAAERDALQQLDSDMRQISSSIDENPELQNLLQNPIINSDVKQDALLGFYGDLTPLALDTIRVLVENKRIELLQNVADQYIILYEELKQEDVAEVTTAVSLDQALEKKLLQKLKTLTGNSVTLNNTIDESILGGFILRIGDIQYNASIANKLENLRREFSKTI
jgi:F-type H+-transporting ATPase subunit delta